MTDNFTSIRMKKIFNLAVLLCGLAALPVQAQLAVPPPTPVYQPLSYQQLDQLLGPIALYPDPLIAQILPASTLPTQIVLADRYVTGGGDPNQIDQQPWDASVQGLARYPNVLKWMDDNLNWTTELGQAFLYQQQDVMDSIQRLRVSARNFGNLQSTPQQQVVDDGGYIEILPTEPQVIYVPVYQPDEVYYQSGFGITFGIGFPIGIWLNCDFDWHHHNLIVWNHDHPRPANWWHEPPRQRDMGRTTIWHPHNNPGVVGLNRGDRGWSVANNGTTAPITRGLETPTTRPSMPVARPAPVPLAHSQPVSRPEAPATRASTPVARPAPVTVAHAAPISRPVSNSAFIGIQSSRETKTFSNRGQQSMQTITHSEPVHSAPVSHPAPSSSGGGGGSHGSGSQPKR
jgi:hypothetical protein